MCDVIDFAVAAQIQKLRITILLPSLMTNFVSQHLGLS